MLSVNQMMAQIKVTEMWKAVNTTNNPLHFKAREIPVNGRITRSNTNGMMESIGCSNLSQNTFIEDSKRLWNNVPDTIKNASTLYMAKKEIKKYCAIFPM